MAVNVDCTRMIKLPANTIYFAAVFYLVGLIQFGASLTGTHVGAGSLPVFFMFLCGTIYTYIAGILVNERISLLTGIMIGLFIVIAFILNYIIIALSQSFLFLIIIQYVFIAFSISQFVFSVSYAVTMCIRRESPLPVVAPQPQAPPPAYSLNPFA